MEARGVTFMAERIWRDSREFGGVFIHEEDARGKATTMTARHGRLSSAPQGETSTPFLVDAARPETATAEAGRPAPRSPASHSPAPRPQGLKSHQRTIPTTRV